MLPARLEPRPSRCLALAVAAVHALAALAVGLAALPWAPRAVLWGAVALSLARHGRALRRPPVLLPGADGHWQLLEAGRRRPARLVRHHVWPALVLLELRLEAGPRRHVLLCRDALPAAQHRRLRAALRGAA